MTGYSRVSAWPLGQAGPFPPAPAIATAEASALLLTIDPLAGLAQQQEQLHQRLLAITPTASPDLRAAWQATADALLGTPHAEPPARFRDIPEQFLILVTCLDEKRQVELLGRFKKDGLVCKALLA